MGQFTLEFSAFLTKKLAGIARGAYLRPGPYGKSILTHPQLNPSITV